MSDATEEEPYYANLASNPGGVPIATGKYRELVRRCFGPWDRFVAWFFRRRREWWLSECTRYGDGQPAVVVSVEPLVVAAYSDELDVVVFVTFPSFVAERHGIELGQRLLSINAYGKGYRPEDVPAAASQACGWDNAFPVIADFLCEGPERIAAATARIPQSDWLRCEQLADAGWRGRRRLIRLGVPPKYDRPQK